MVISWHVAERGCLLVANLSYVVAIVVLVWVPGKRWCSHTLRSCLLRLWSQSLDSNPRRCWLVVWPWENGLTISCQAMLGLVDRWDDDQQGESTGPPFPHWVSIRGSWRRNALKKPNSQIHTESHSLYYQFRLWLQICIWIFSSSFLLHFCWDINHIPWSLTF